MLARPATGLISLSAPLLALGLLAGCSQDATNAPSTATVTVTPSSAAPEIAGSGTATLPEISTGQTPATAPPTSPAPTSPAPTSPAGGAPTPAGGAPTPAGEPGVLAPCSDAALTVSAGQVEEVDTIRRVVVTFVNSSSETCGLVSYPAANLLSAAGEVLVHVAKRPANAAPRLTLQPGDAATADVQSSATDSATGQLCGRTGTLAVTPPDNTAQRVLEVNLPICDATISSVG